jgi:hypothetical protein
MFPNFYDIKFVADQLFGYFRGGLTSLSEKLDVIRDDNCEHQAGSDSKITAKCFIELYKINKGVVLSCVGEIYGILNTKEVKANSGNEKNLEGSVRS